MNLKQIRTVEGVQLAFSYLIKAILVASAAVAIWNFEWEVLFVSLLALALTFIPALFERNYKINLPVEFELVVIVIVFAAVFLGEVQGYYTRFWWWDLILHTGSGLGLGFIGFLMLYILHYQKKLIATPGLIAFFAFCFAVALGSLWEIFEFSMDTVFGLNMQKTGLIDTMWDIIVNAAGGFITALVGYFYLKSKTENSFSRLLKKFIVSNPGFKRKR